MDYRDRNELIMSDLDTREALRDRSKMLIDASDGKETANNILLTTKAGSIIGTGESS